MILSWLGLILGFGGILMGNWLEGSEISALIQPTAAMIVAGGTIGATMLACTMAEFTGALRAIPKAFFSREQDLGPLVAEIIGVATAARKEGVLALEKVVNEIKDPFFSQNLRHVVDGYDPLVLKSMMETRLYHEEEEKNAVAKVWETAGGFAPTIGILGAVLGLIHVMSNLSDPSKLGGGIAVAFVATVYGVGGANLLLIPLGNKLKKISKAEVLRMYVIAEGISSIQAGLNPRVIEDRLANLVGHHAGGASHEGAAAEKKAA
ncbi:MAG: flagellar motor protein [Deltaproteobacteria bacterium]|nr:flagellar motor protein [Deltaproteobacteria bacterium]MBI3295178.1 flagellar motor protein [Deltaproteobacteria bacterium]